MADTVDFREGQATCIRLNRHRHPLFVPVALTNTMTFNNSGVAVGLAICFATLSLAADGREPSAATGREIAATGISGEAFDLAHVRTKPADSSTTTTSTTTTTLGEVFKKIVIAAGKSTSLDSTVDYTYAGSVAVTVLCTTCSSSAASLGTLGLVLQANWAIADADSWVATDRKAASTFPYWDAGGAIFQVYGANFRLTLQNTGTSSITLQQVTIFPRTMN